MSLPRETVRQFARFQSTMRKWAAPAGLKLERLEDRLAPALVQPLSESDPRFWGDTGDKGSGVDSVPFVSADGQRVIFESDADNLVPNDFNAVRDVFIYDRGSGKMTTILNKTKTGTSERGAFEFDATPDGRYITFRSDSSDLPDPAPINNFFQGQHRVWWHDTLTGQTKLVSADPAGNDTGAAFEPQISDDGQFVVFGSNAGTVLTPENGTTSTTQIFLRGGAGTWLV